MKALGNALKEPENFNKTGRLYRFIGYAISAESKENLLVRKQMHAVLRTAAITSAQLVKVGYPIPLTPHLQAITLILDGFSGLVTPLNPIPLTKILASIRSRECPPSRLFIHIGSLIAKTSNINDLLELADIRSRLALNVNIFEVGDDADKRIASQIQTLLEIVSAYEALEHEKYCVWCYMRMSRYWTINLKPLRREDGVEIHAQRSAKVCETCKSDSTLLEAFDVTSNTPKHFR